MENTSLYKLARHLFRGLSSTGLITPDTRRKLRLQTTLKAPSFRRSYVISHTVAFNQKLNFEQNPNARYRIATLWESDGTFKYLEAAKKENPNFELLHMPRSLFDEIWRDHLFREYRKDARVGDPPLDRYYQPEWKKLRQQFLKFCQDVTKIIKTEFSIDAFLLPKLNDDWITDLIKAILKNQYPIIVNDREIVSTNKRMEVYPPILKKCLDFEVDSLCVASPHHYSFFEKSGLNTKKMNIIGKLSMDYWKRKDLWRSRQEIHSSLRDDKKQILFFSFGTNNYLNFFYKDETRDWLNLAHDYHHILFEVIKKYGDAIRVVYKSGGKPQRDYYPGYENFIQKLKDHNLSHCLVPLNFQYNSLDLVRTSDLVIGFQTTGLMEAMFTDNLIVSGGWGPLHEDVRETLVPFHKTKALHFFDHPTEMEQFLLKAIEMSHPLSSQERESRNQFLSKYYSKVDGKVGQRLLMECEHVIQEKAKNHTPKSTS